MKINKNIKNIFSLFSSEFIARLVGFIATIYLARRLGTDNFGILNIGLAVLNYAAIFSASGLNMLGTRKTAERVEGDNAILNKLIISKFSLTIVISIITFFIVTFFVHSEATSEIIFIYLLYLLPSVFIIDWYFQGKETMGVITVGRSVGMTVYLIFVLLFVNTSADIISAAYAWVIGAVVNAIILWIFLTKRIKVKLFSIKIISSFNYIRESVPLGAATIISQVVIMFPILYIGAIYSEEQAGIYSAAYRIIILLLVADRIFSTMFFPKIVNLITKRSEKLESVFNSILKIITFFSFYIGFVSIIFADTLVITIFGTEYNNSVFIFQLLIGYFILTLINSVFSFTLIGMKEEKSYSVAMFIGMIGFFISLFVLDNLYSITGIAISLIIYEILTIAYMINKVNKIILINLKEFIPSLVIFAAIFILLIIYIFDFSILAKFVIAILLLIILFYFCNIKKKEIDLIKGVIS
ncbi:MAG: oligosaccharide flippase family protein [Ignavibacteriales bacterium]|nr:oligosaccharide flippase family protein [Ignavibacteriales bacterium]